VIFLVCFTFVVMSSLFHFRLSVWLTWLQRSRGQYLEHEGIILRPEGDFIGKLPRPKIARDNGDFSSKWLWSNLI